MGRAVGASVRSLIEQKVRGQDWDKKLYADGFEFYLLSNVMNAFWNNTSSSRSIVGGRGFLRPRRAFLADLGMGFTGLALGAMLKRDARAAGAAAASGAAKAPNAWGLPDRSPKAKSVIWLFMNGGVSQIGRAHV